MNKKKIIILFLMNVFLVFWTPLLADAAIGSRDWKWPVPATNSLSSCYLDGRAHYALDLSAGGGSSIYASYPGEVIYVYKGCNYDYGKNGNCPCGSCGDLGNSVYIKHNYKGAWYVSRYGHMRTVNVSVGQNVTKDTVLGTVGSTGYSNGNHLDFRIYRGSTKSHIASRDAVDPFKDEFLEMPSGLNANAATTSCCYTYVNEVKALYSTPSDTTPPIISNVQVSNITKDGYTITCDVLDNVSVTSVKFPAWPDGISDAIVWHEGTINGNTASCRINISDHRNIININYATHIYAYDAAGNVTQSAAPWVYMDGTAPKITNVTVSDITEDGYTITCTVTDDRKISKVLFPTWTHYNGQDDLSPEWKSSSKYVGTINGNTVTYHVNVSAHSNEGGVYYTHIYAYDVAGNENGDLRTVITLDGKVFEPLKTVAYGNSRYEIYGLAGDEEVQRNLSQWTGVKTYCESLGGHLAAFETKAEWDYVKSQLGISVSGYWVGSTDEVNEGEWKWITGENVTFTEWSEGEPNNWTDSQHYMAVRASDRLWDDEYLQPISEKYGFILEIENNEYTINYNANGGTGAPAAQSVAVGSKITLSSAIPTRSGHKFKGWSPSSTATVEKYLPGETFAVEGSMTLYAVWEEEKIEDVYVNPFSDVSDSAWYAAAVRYVYENGIMSGNNGLFNPTGNITRAQLVTTLYRIAGEPKVINKQALTDFTDVAEGKFYTDAVCWAYATGVGTGNGDKFNPTGQLTRQQLAAFFYRFAEYQGADITVRSDISKMEGADKVSEYAKDAVEWAVGAGLISGSKITNANGATVYDLKPKDNTTRAQVAVILQRFCENNNGIVKEYTVSWKAEEGKFISVRRAESPFANATIGILENGDKIYEGDILKVSYSTHDAWQIDSHGKENITVTGNVDSKQIYMTVWGEWSDWTENVISESASVKTETKKQYRYSDKQTTTSTNSSLSGWTQTGSETSYGAWGEWSAWQTEAVGGSDTREVQTSTIYGYYYFLCPSCGAHMHGWPTCYSWAGGCGKSTMSINNGVMIWSTTSWNSASLYDFHGTGKYATDSLGGGRWFKYAEGGTPVGYRYHDRSKTITYSYEKWSTWSNWSDNVYTENNNRQIQTRTVYRSRTKF